MKGAIKISSVLSWINLVFFGLSGAIWLLNGLLSGNVLSLLVGVILSAVVLHSYATLRLHKSLRDPSLPLNDQTPTGIRFVGFVALFLGLMCIAAGIVFLKNGKAFLEMVNAPGMPHLEMDEKAVRAGSFQCLILGLSITINVVLSVRLLRWYYMMHEDDNKEDAP